MKTSRPFRLSRRLIPVACLAGCLVYPALVHARVRAVAALPVAEQKQAGNQRILQKWAIGCVRAFQERLSGTALGDATAGGRRLVDFGNADDYRRRVLAAPEGAGRSLILWDGVATATFDPADNNIHFPAAQFSLDAGTASTVWHEFNHALMDLAISNLRRGYANPLPSPSVWSGLFGGDTDEEHYYIEGLGERTMDWLFRLLVQGKFETSAAQAASDENRERDAGKKVNWHREHEIWERPAGIWATAWPAAKKIAPLPLSDRRQYDRFCGVSLPLPEDVQKFYVTGGLQSARREIKVHEWAVAHRRVLCDVLIQESGRTGPKAVKDALVSGFELRLTENYKDCLPATRGTLHVFIRGADDAAWLDVSIGGKSLSGQADQSRPGRWFEIDLVPHRQALLDGSPFVVKAARPVKDLHRLMKDKDYSIEVLYRDPSSASSPSIYKPAEARFSLKITAADVPADAVSGPPVAGLAAPAPTSGRKTRYLSDEERNARTYWELYEEDSKQGSEPANSVRTAAVIAGGSGAVTIEWRVKDPRNDSPTHGKMIPVTGRGSWSPPPGRIHFGQPVKLNWSNEIHGWSFGSVMEITTEGMAIGLKDVKRLSVQPGTKSDATGQWEGMLAPPSNPRLTVGQRAALNVMFRTPAGWYLHVYRYRAVRPPEYVPDDSPHKPAAPEDPPSRATTPPGGSGGIVRVDVPRVPPPDKDADDVPPEPGETIPLRPPPRTETTPPPSPSGKRPWYRHPSGDYRFPLAAGWRLGRPAGDLDPVTSPDGSMVIFCGRDFGDASRLADPVAAYEARLASLFAGAAFARRQIGAAAAALARVHNPAARQTQWQLYLLHGGRVYYVMIAINADTAMESLPKEIADMLDTSLWPN